MYLSVYYFVFLCFLQACPCLFFFVYLCMLTAWRELPTSFFFLRELPTSSFLIDGIFYKSRLKIELALLRNLQKVYFDDVITNSFKAGFRK